MPWLFNYDYGNMTIDVKKESMMSSNTIPAGQFKTHCLQIMETVRKTGKTITITKRNVPIAQIGPIEKKEQKVFGKLKGTVHVEKNIIDPIDEDWYADS